MVWHKCNCVQAENINRQGDGVSARDVDSAIAALSVSGQPAADPHPERCTL